MTAASPQDPSAQPSVPAEPSAPDRGRLRVLVTNDDGVDSPALPPLVRAVAPLGTIEVVAPDGERSWSGKHLSRLERIPIATVTRDGVDMVAVGGSPADAAQIGCHRGHPTDLVLSGINLGHNHGTAFLMSSGTVGAAIEAGLTGHRAIALSTGIIEGDFMAWRRHAHSPQARGDWERVAAVAAAIVDDILDAGLLDHCDVVSVNLPWEVEEATARVLTGIARTGYGPVYAREGEGDDQPRRGLVAPGGRRPEDTVAIRAPLHTDAGATAEPIEHWVPSYSGLRFLDDDLAGTDIGAAHDGHVSITPVRLPRAADVPDHVATRLADRNGRA